MTVLRSQFNKGYNLFPGFNFRNTGTYYTQIELYSNVFLKKKHICVVLPVLRIPMFFRDVSVRFSGIGKIHLDRLDSGMNYIFKIF